MATQENRSMVSEVSIVNQALLWLGSKAITSLSDDSKEARWMKNNYPFIRDAVLEERRWTFAVERATSTVNDLDPWGQMYVHPLPAEWISVFRVFRHVRAEAATWDRGWQVEGRNILSKWQTIYMRGIRRVTDTGIFSPLFVQALAARLAADAAIPLTENRQLQSDMWNLYSAKLAEAAAQDGSQGSNEYTEAETFINARGYGGYGGGV